MMRVPSLDTFFLSVDSRVAPFMLQVVEGVGTPTLLQDSEMFSFHGVTMLRLNDVILAGTRWRIIKTINDKGQIKIKSS